MAQPAYTQEPHAPAKSSNTGGTNVMAILSLVFAFVFSPLGIVFGTSPRSRSGRPASRARAWPRPVTSSAGSSPCWA